MLKKTFELVPVDTLFFRGNEPMEAGQLGTSVLFPPPESVILGALRTAYLVENQVDFGKYKGGQADPVVYETIGKASGPPPFKLTGFFLRKNHQVFLPMPYTWYWDDSQNSLLVARPLDDKTKETLGLNGTSLDMAWVSSKKAKPLGGLWVPHPLPNPLSLDHFSPSDNFYDEEPRVGISRLDPDGKVTKVAQEGKLFSGIHLRLREGVSLVILLDQDPGIGDSGVLTLGGEQRACRFQGIPDIPITTWEGSLVPLKLTQENCAKIVAAGKPTIRAGWDLAKGFHKPSETWVPAGTVLKP